MNAPERLGLSAQEAAIVLGKRAVHDNVSERVLRLFERAVYFTESFKETEGQPIVLRFEPVPLAEVVNRVRAVELSSPAIVSARGLGLSLGDAA